MATTEDDPPMHQQAFFLALHHANEAARLNHVPITVIEVGSSFRSDMHSEWTRLIVDNPTYNPIVQALDDYETFDKQRYEHHREKVASNTQAYVCAAEGCGLRGLKKRAMKACSGPCSVDIKPHYCSKECQRKDWPRHKMFCHSQTLADRDSSLESRPSSALIPSSALTPTAFSGSASNEVVPSGKLTFTDKDLGHHHGRHVAEVSVGGINLRISGNALSPEALRQCRDFIVSEALRDLGIRPSTECERDNDVSEFGAEDDGNIVLCSG
ncbi:hypothetical protein C8Q76DRAFT_753031 [Earliella scabrosa]|nr:hypothetical protein C8Q76DRAFT_753031 [Earliella scabrosa]